jgi:hypothetical protein
LTRQGLSIDGRICELLVRQARTAVILSLIVLALSAASTLKET